MNLVETVKRLTVYNAWANEITFSTVSFLKFFSIILMPEKVLIITGASRGIGAATAHLAAERGYAVCVNYRHNQAAAEQVVAAIKQMGGNAIAIAADIASEPDVVSLFETVDKHLGSVTALVNNAGILERQMRVEAMDAARLNRIFITNITGAFLCAREAVKRMSTQRGGAGGSIVNVSSGASRLGSPGEYVDYAASKGAIDTMTIGLRQRSGCRRYSGQCSASRIYLHRYSRKWR